MHIKLKNLLIIFIILIISSIKPLYALQSVIVNSNGYACLGEDRTKRQTEKIALEDAKRNAIEQASTYIQSETKIKNGKLQKDIINAYSNAKVRIIESNGIWDHNPPRIGDCYKINVKAEIMPDEETMKKLSQKVVFDDPTAPLKVSVWTDKKVYKEGEKIKLYIKGNKPFYARILYKQSDGSLIQLLPNPYRINNYFQGGVIYEIPSGPDRFELEVTPPFGDEEIIVYASTEKLGDINLEEVGGVYFVKSSTKEIGEKTRGIKIISKKNTKAGEFVEEKVKINTN